MVSMIILRCPVCILKPHLNFILTSMDRPSYRFIYLLVKPLGADKYLQEHMGKHSTACISDLQIHSKKIYSGNKT